MGDASANDGTAIYRLLGLDPEATPEEIRSAYHKKALKTHPDKNPDDPAATARFAKVKKAYDLLSDETQRRAWHERYDLPWLWGVEEEAPPEDLNWACAACSVTMYKCGVCKVRLCPHFTIMLTLKGFAPRPVCIDCKRNYNDKKHANWKLKQMIKQKFGGGL